MRKFLSLPLFIAVMLLMASSCLSDNSIIAPKPLIDREKTADVILRISTPEGFAGSRTRALDFEGENRLNTITVLVFDTNNQLADIRQGREVTYTPGYDGTISGVGAFEVTLRASASPTDVFRLVVLANAADIVAARLGTTPDFSNYDAVMARIWSDIDGRMFQTCDAIPMWGETQRPVLVVEDGDLPEVITLHRSIARIDVGVGRLADGGNSETGFTWTGLDNANNLIPFELVSVYIMRPNTRFAVTPAGGTLPVAVSGNPTIPTGTNSFTVEQSVDLFRFETTTGYVQNRIYTPEANTGMPIDGVAVDPQYQRSGDLNHTNRMAIVVGGRFDGSSVVTYYRVDFQQNNSLINVLRNHLYQINIMGVSGPGERNPEEAYASHSMNIDVEIIDWVQSTQETFFDGINWIRLHNTRNQSLSRHAMLYRPADTTDELRFETTISPSQWDLSSLQGQNDFYNSVVTPNAPNFEVNGVTHTVLQTVENDRFRVELIATVTETAAGRTIYHGLFRFTSLEEYNSAPNSILWVEAGRMVGTSRIINFPITITQRGDSPDDWICGGYDDFELGEED